MASEKPIDLQKFETALHDPEFHEALKETVGDKITLSVSLQERLVYAKGNKSVAVFSFDEFMEIAKDFFDEVKQ